MPGNVGEEIQEIAERRRIPDRIPVRYRSPGESLPPGQKWPFRSL